MAGKIGNTIGELRALGLGRPSFWQDARMVFAEVPVDYDKVKNWVPFPLRLERPAKASVFIADYPKTSFGSVYREAAIMLHVRLFGLIPMVHCPWMIVDDDRALILGRELLGYPKKMGIFRFEERDGRFFGSVTRHGEEVFRIEGEIGAPLAAPPPGIGRWQANIRSLLASFFAHLLIFRPRETVHRANAMNARVTLKSAPEDPIDIMAGPAGTATIRTCDIGGGAVPLLLRIWPVGPVFVARLMRLRVR
jgi:Acetoacetate decarboxylase (ADC)